MHQVYCISGLGADHRIFQKLKIDNAQLHFIEWELPDEKDNMQSFALRLARQIKHPEITLIGVSYGGMLATEINRFYNRAKKNHSLHPDHPVNFPVNIKKTILISSCKSRNEFPRLMQLAAKFRLHKAVPYHFILRNKALNRFVFDLQSKQEELHLKRMMLKQHDVTLIKRSINIIFEWDNEIPNELVHIHGTKDRLLTPVNVMADHWVKGGGHFMIYNRATEISGIINKILQD